MLFYQTTRLRKLRVEKIKSQVLHGTLKTPDHRDVFFQGFFTGHDPTLAKLADRVGSGPGRVGSGSGQVGSL